MVLASGTRAAKDRRDVLDADLLRGAGEADEALLASENYRFVHLNFDRWENHLTRLSVQVGARNIVKIMRRQGCSKAAYAYSFFGLQALEVDTFDAAQGMDNQNEESEAVAELRKLAAEFGQ